jgi:uncharacterized protein (DUF4415 family)
MKKTSKSTVKRQYDFSAGKRGAVLANPGKSRITIYVDNEVLDAFRACAESEGRGYQTAINQALREAVLSGESPIEERVGEVIRKEMESLRKVASLLTHRLDTIERKRPKAR